jgi:hypothetical protein
MTDIKSMAARTVVLALIISSSVDAQRITRRESRGEVHNRVTVSTVLTAIDNSPRVTNRLNGLGVLTAERIRVIDVRPYIAAPRRSTYNASLESNAQHIERLRAELVTLDPVVRVLAARRPQLTVDDVVAAGILDVIETGKSSNVLVLYVDSGNRLGKASSQSRTLTTYRPTTPALLNAVYTSPEMVARVSSLESLRLDRVRFFDVDAIVQPADADSYRTAVRQNESSIRALRAELSKRPLIMHALARHDAKLKLGDIFAADILGEEDVLVLYYKRKAAVTDNGGT